MSPAISAQYVETQICIWSVITWQCEYNINQTNNLNVLQTPCLRLKNLSRQNKFAVY